MKGFLPLSTLNYADPAATWQVFRERRATLAVTSAQWYLIENNRAASSALTWIPNSDGRAFALADGWSWAIVNSAPEQHTLTADLLLWLTQPAQLSAWTQAAHMLPPRSKALDQWKASPLTPVATLRDILTHAELVPSAEVLSLVGPPLHQALTDVLNGQATPSDAAVLAAQTITNP
jgi:ABC-type glycerol-3-phosphate transport system substrate-binding protein